MVFREKMMDKSGFTLMEMMIVISIIGIISAIAIPNIIAWLPEYRLRSVTRDIVSCFQETKMKAVKENAIAAIFFNVGGNEYTAWVDNGAGGGISGNLIKDGGEIIFQQTTLPDNISFYQNTNFTADTFGFNSRGVPATTVGTVFINNTKSNYRKVIISIAGNIRVQKSSDGVTWID